MDGKHLIQYTADSSKEIKDTITATKIKYNIKNKTLEESPEEIFDSDYSSVIYGGHQWNQENELVIFIEKLKQLSKSDNFVVRKDIIKNYKIDGVTYKLSMNEQGFVLQESSGDKTDSIKVDLLKEDKNYTDSTPMTLFKYGNDIMILFHNYCPIQNNGMASGLYPVKISNKNAKIEKIDLKDQCCINYEAEPVVINDNIYINTYSDIGYISISKKCFNNVTFFEPLKNEVKSDPALMQYIPDAFRSQPVIGKIGDILLLSYGTLSNNYIWGIHDDKVIFKIKTSNNKIFDETGTKIGTTSKEINTVLLPNW